MMDDASIVALYWQRSEAALQHTADKYGRYCHAIALGILDSQPDAEECVNDTWLRAWHSMPPKRPEFLGGFFGAHHAQPFAGQAAPPPGGAPRRRGRAGAGRTVRLPARAGNGRKRI